MNKILTSQELYNLKTSMKFLNKDLEYSKSLKRLKKIQKDKDIRLLNHNINRGLVIKPNMLFYMYDFVTNNSSIGGDVIRNISLSANTYIYIYTCILKSLCNIINNINIYAEFKNISYGTIIYENNVYEHIINYIRNIMPDYSKELCTKRVIPKEYKLFIDEAYINETNISKNGIIGEYDYTNNIYTFFTTDDTYYVEIFNNLYNTIYREYNILDFYISVTIAIEFIKDNCLYIKDPSLIKNIIDSNFLTIYITESNEPIFNTNINYNPELLNNEFFYNGILTENPLNIIDNYSFVDNSI